MSEKHSPFAYNMHSGAPRHAAPYHLGLYCSNLLLCSKALKFEIHIHTALFGVMHWARIADF